MEPEVLKQGKVWSCKIGFASEDADLNDQEMRDAVGAAFEYVARKKREFIFSGWNTHLQEKELAVVEDRMPDPQKALLMYIMKRPSGTYIPRTIMSSEDECWAMRIDPLVIFDGHDPKDVKAALVEEGYKVVPVEIMDVGD